MTTVTICSSRSTGKERDAESGNDYFGARYYASSMGRFMSPDWSAKVMPVPYAKLDNPQSLNLYSYVWNNPLSRNDPTGHFVPLKGDDAERLKQLNAIKGAVGTKAGAYLYDNVVDGKHYVGILTGGPDGKGPSFNSINAVANKIGGIVQDTTRGASLQFVEEGTWIGNHQVGPAPGMTPAVTHATANGAEIYLTSGPIGHLQNDVMAQGSNLNYTLSDVVGHELAHVDAKWYHGGADSNGDAVRTEDQIRQMEGEPQRLGHDSAGDVPLSGQPY
jgi:RHS repeat-associated protein